MTLHGSATPLAEAYDAALLDLDGVVYVGPDAVPGAAAALQRARAAGMRLAFVTNNASRTPETVAAHLSALGIPARPEEVVTSAQAAAHLLADRLPAGTPVLVVGGEGLLTAIRAAGLRPVSRAEDGPAAVVQGYTQDIGYAQLAEATLAVRAGALWVAANTDTTMPSARGLLPGNGALVAAVRAATGVEPDVAGKPHLPLHREAVARTRAQRPLVVGDRLDTDIEGAVAAGVPSLLVLTGVAGPADVLGAPPHARPTYLAADLDGLLHPHPEVVLDGSETRCAGWTARVAEGRLTVVGDGDPLDALRAGAVAAWNAADGGAPVAAADLPPLAAGSR